MLFNISKKIYDALVFGARFSTGNFGRNLNPANYPNDVPLTKDTDKLANWPGIPWDDPHVQSQVKKSEWGKAFLTNLIFFKDKIAHTNMCMEMPGRLTNPSALSNGPFKQWKTDAVTKGEFLDGKIALNLSFNNSPRLRIDIGSPYNRGFFIGTRINIHMGGQSAFFNHTLDYTSLEERMLWIHGHSITHYSCKKPKQYETIQNWMNNGKKISDCINDHPYQKEVEELINSFGANDYGTRPQSWPDQNNRDECRIDAAFRTQVWERSEGVVRRESIAVDDQFVFSNGNLKMKGPATIYQEGLMKDIQNKTPALSSDSPHTLYESRPKDFSEVEGLGSTASQIFAGPHFMICGIENRQSGSDEPSITESSGYYWATKNLQKINHENVFAITDKKNLSKCWEGMLPKKSGQEIKSDPTYNSALGVFGMFGGTSAISTIDSANNMIKKDGLEIFGQTLLLGAHAKSDKNKWSSELLMQKDEIRLTVANDKGMETGLVIKSGLIHILVDGKKSYCIQKIDDAVSHEFYTKAEAAHQPILFETTSVKFPQHYLRPTVGKEPFELKNQPSSTIEVFSSLMLK